MNYFFKNLLLLLSLLTSLSLCRPHRTINVKPGGTIQSAIDLAKPGTTIVVPPGIYTEQLSITTPHITLIGHNSILTPPSTFKNNTCTNLAGSGTQAGICISGSKIVLQDLKDFNGEHLKVLSVGKSIKGTTITGFSIKNFGGLGIAIVGGENTVINGNTVTSSSQYGVLTVGSENTRISNNIVSSVPGVFQFYFIGICMDDRSSVSISHNDISSYFIGLCVQTPRANIYENYVHGVCAGAFVDPGVEGARIRRNRFADTLPTCPTDTPVFSSGVSISGGIGTLVEGNRFEKLRNGVVIVDDDGGDNGGVKVVARGNVVLGNWFKGVGVDLVVNSTGRNVDRATTIRLRTTSYMRRHSSYFKLFLSVPPPTRKTRSSSSTTLPNEDTIDRVFQDYIKRMEKPGVYGDNLEIVAFARCYGVDVKIYQREFAYLVSGERDAGEESDDDAGNSMLGKEEPVVGERKVMHIAYHDWEHYSSVRNIDGPHKGLPNVSPKPLTEEGRQKQQKVLEEGVVIMPWMEDVVEKSLPGDCIVTKQKIREALEKSKGDVGLAVSKLLDAAEADAEAEEAEVEPDIDAEGEKVASKEKEENTGRKKPINDDNRQKKKPPPYARQTGNKAKRETARERKERQQKEKIEKKKAKANGSSGSGVTSGKDSKGSGATATSANTPMSSNEGIKTLHV
ncbi:hypothetical protein TWF106_007011 [Orbilia oligospora]|uniref:OTU domain-containing protein n=1 Tax=Orbilia oligospora TaxID=2813651 RepID=A0A7C8QPS8_ORBOL|nr:hypothetical protein TWF106_007011 [Orbilia oligospora]